MSYAHLFGARTAESACFKPDRNIGRLESRPNPPTGMSALRGAGFPACGFRGLSSPRLKRLLIFLAALFTIGPIHAETVSPVRLDTLACEHLSNPVGIGFAQPRLSWKLRSDRTGEIQTAWQIRAASSASGLETKPDLWDSGKVNSGQSVLVPWAGKSLDSRSQVFWQVRVWDKDGQPSAWSDVALFELGLLSPAAEWKGQWITADLPRHNIMQSTLARAFWISAGSVANQSAAVRLRVELPSNAPIRRAMIDAAADGLLTIYANGHPTRQGASSRTAPLHAEVGARLAPGTNLVAIGSAAVRNAIRRDRGEAGRNAIAARGIVELENGRRIEFNTDESWRAATAPAGDWFAPGYDDSAWLTATNLGPYAAAPSKYCDNTIGPGRYLRKHFTVKGPVAKARLYATALGVYEASLNGRRVGNSLLDPGWTDYRTRVMVQTYDVTSLLNPGENTVGAALGDGWYAGRLGWMGLAQYGTRPVFNAQLEITYADGTSDIIATDKSWQAGPGEIIGSDAQWGEIIDARRAVPGWNQPDTITSSSPRDNGAGRGPRRGAAQPEERELNTSSPRPSPPLRGREGDKSGDSAVQWTDAVVEQHDIALVPQLGPPVRRLMELAPRNITRRGDAWIVDLGQNLVGFIRLAARGPAGTTITLRHGEMLDADGSLYTENLRPALATDTFILAGRSGRETFEPHFTFHGFQHVEITGYPGELTTNDLRAVVVGSDTPSTGSFECSHPGLNRLYQNIVWGQRGNFLSVPTDCPQRDERMGWMGDAQVFAPTAARNADVAAFFAKWLVDVADSQTTNGDYSDVCPRIARPRPAMPVWGDAGVIIPWEIYNAYGDRAFLADNYPFMVRWLEFSLGRSTNLILTGGVGDHLAPQRTPTDVVDTAYFAHAAQLVARTAAILGKTNDAARYDRFFRDIADAFNQNFVSTNGLMKGDTQTAYILALQFDLLPSRDGGIRAAAAARLAEDVERNGHLTTGFVGVGLICPTLTQIGRSDLAWQLVLTNTYPSWLFSVKNGATTIWERWDGWTPERGFQDSAMNSFNHYSLGSVGAWLYSGAGGIQPDDSRPGYKHFYLQPQFTRRLDYVKASLDSPYGLIVSHWQVKGDQLLYDVTIPPNSSATLVLPVPPQAIRQSGQPLSISEGSTTRLPLVGGTYHFSLPRELVH
jgi:alpha-L-rhamnosidase